MEVSQQLLHLLCNGIFAKKNLMSASFTPTHSILSALFGDAGHPVMTIMGSQAMYQLSDTARVLQFHRH